MKNIKLYEEFDFSKEELDDLKDDMSELGFEGPRLYLVEMERTIDDPDVDTEPQYKVYSVVAKNLRELSERIIDIFEEEIEDPNECGEAVNRDSFEELYPEDTFEEEIKKVEDVRKMDWWSNGVISGTYTLCDLRIEEILGPFGPLKGNPESSFEEANYYVGTPSLILPSWIESMLDQYKKKLTQNASEIKSYVSKKYPGLNIGM